jgi:hypothetical protein
VARLDAHPNGIPRGGGQDLRDPSTQLALSPPAPLVTGLRLGACNGMQLEVERLGAIRVARPLAAMELEAALRRVPLWPGGRNRIGES